MNKIVFLILCILMVGCASTPKVRVKNCKAIGDNLYECEELPNRDYNARK